MLYRLLKDLNWKLLCVTLSFIITAYFNDIDNRNPVQNKSIQPIEKSKNTKLKIFNHPFRQDVPANTDYIDVPVLYMLS